MVIAAVTCCVLRVVGNADPYNGNAFPLGEVPRRGG